MNFQLFLQTQITDKLAESLTLANSLFDDMPQVMNKFVGFPDFKEVFVFSMYLPSILQYLLIWLSLFIYGYYK